MLKKFFTGLIFAMLSLTAMSADLPNAVTAAVAVNPKEVTNVVLEKASLEDAETEHVKHVVSDSTQSDTTSTDVWLISIALLGFVMLSNRSGV